jgi:hypothetical protein
VRLRSKIVLLIAVVTLFIAVNPPEYVTEFSSTIGAPTTPSVSSACTAMREAAAFATRTWGSAARATRSVADREYASSRLPSVLMVFVQRSCLALVTAWFSLGIRTLLLR